MARVTFASSIQRHVPVADTDAAGATVREVLDKVFAEREQLRGYVVDDQGALRHHVLVFVDGEHVNDRARLSDPVGAHARIHVLQALSGG